MRNLERYQRQLILPEIGRSGQIKLSSSKVLIVGAGGLGCPLYQTLAAAGIGHIGMVDGDDVSLSNLARQTLFAPSDIGKPKVDVIGAHAKHFHPSLDLRVYKEYLDSTNALQIIADYDIILDGTDNFLAQFLINDACVILNKPWVFASILRYEIQVSTFNYKNGPTYRCLYPEPPKKNIPSCSDAGVISTLPPIAANIQANECIKVLLGIGKTLSGILWQIDLLSNQWTEIAFDRQEPEEIKDLTKIEQMKQECKTTLIKEVNWIEVQDRLSDFYLLDVRTEEEYQNFNIGGDNVSLQHIADHHDYIPSGEKPTLVICAAGVRSKAAIEILQERSPKLNLINLTGGLNTVL